MSSVIGKTFSNEQSKAPTSKLYKIFLLTQLPLPKHPPSLHLMSPSSTTTRPSILSSKSDESSTSPASPASAYLSSLHTLATVVRKEVERRTSKVEDLYYNEATSIWGQGGTTGGGGGKSWGGGKGGSLGVAGKASVSC
jgi:hypothetical protein